MKDKNGIPLKVGQKVAVAAADLHPDVQAFLAGLGVDVSQPVVAHVHAAREGKAHEDRKLVHDRYADHFPGDAGLELAIVIDKARSDFFADPAKVEVKGA